MTPDIPLFVTGASNFRRVSGKNRVPRSDEPLLGHGQTRRCQRVQIASAFTAVLDQPGIPENAQVLRNSWSTNGQALGKMSHRGRPLVQELKDLATRWFS